MELVDLGRVAVSFLLVLGLILAIAWVARRLKLDERFQGTRAKGSLAIVETLYIDPRRRLILVSGERKRHLLLLGPQGDLLLSSNDEEATVVANEV